MYFLGAQDLTALANNLYSVYTCNPDLAGGSLKEQLETLSREEFVQQLVQTHKERWSSGEAQKDFLYAGSSQRASLSDTEIAALVNKYDPHSMSQKEYSSFLDDLADMGAISQYEKRLMGYNGMVSLGYFDAGGAFVGSSWDAQILPGNQADVRSPAEAGDVLGGLRDMLSRQNVVMGGMDQEAKEQNRERYEAVSGILERMEALQKPQSGEDGKKGGPGAGTGHHRRAGPGPGHHERQERHPPLRHHPLHGGDCAADQRAGPPGPGAGAAGAVPPAAQ